MLTPDEDEYSFSVDAFTPSTIPMARLAEYMSLIAALLANPEYVHFAKLKAGSTQVITRVRREAIPKVHERLQESSQPDSSSEARKIYRKLDDMVRRDNGTARLKRKQSGAKRSAEILYFPGREQERRQLGPFAQPIVLDGVVCRVGGRDSTAHVQIEDSEGRIFNGELARDLAKQVAMHIYDSLRFEGDARWLRLSSGEWEIKDLRIKSFLKLRDDTTVDAFARLRQIEGSEWTILEDPLSFARDLRNEDDIE